MLIRPAINAKFYWLIGLTVLNAAISAGYYLRIVGAMFLSSDDVPEESGQEAAAPTALPLPALVAIACAVVGTLVLGVIPAASDLFDDQVKAGTTVYAPVPYAPSPAHHGS